MIGQATAKGWVIKRSAWSAFIARSSVLVGAAALVACASQSNIKEVMLPLAVVRKIVMENVPAGMKKESMNGREITGEYFDPKNLDESGADKRERAYAIITILGSRRPYQITVAVFRQKRAKGSKSYDDLGQDSRLARQVSNRIKEVLANRPADINVIDDFRAF